MIKPYLIYMELSCFQELLWNNAAQQYYGKHKGNHVEFAGFRRASFVLIVGCYIKIMNIQANES